MTITSVRTHVKSMGGTRLDIESSTFEIDKKDSTTTRLRYQSFDNRLKDKSRVVTPICRYLVYKYLLRIQNLQKFIKWKFQHNFLFGCNKSSEGHKIVH